MEEEKKNEDAGEEDLGCGQQVSHAIMRNKVIETRRENASARSSFSLGKV